MVRPVVAVSVALVHAGRILLVERARAPNAGRLAFPGGRVEPGETLIAAASRELREETGLEAELSGPVAVREAIRRNPRGGLLSHHLILVMEGHLQGGEARAGSDAAALAWWDREALAHGEARLCEGVAEIARQCLARVPVGNLR